jgi:predicted amidohydrolase
MPGSLPLTLSIAMTAPGRASDPFRFWGGREIISPYGQTIATAERYHPDAIDADISRDLIRKKRIALPYLRNDDPFFTHRELGRILFGKHTSGDPVSGTGPV